MNKSFITHPSVLPIIALLVLVYGVMFYTPTIPKNSIAPTLERKVIYNFFIYGCTPCASFYTFIKKLDAQLPDHYQIEPIPVIKNDITRLQARLHYTAIHLNMLQAVEADAYKQGPSLATKEEMEQFLVKHSQGKLTQYIVDTTFRSGEVTREIERAERMYKQFNIHDFPALVVEGKVIDKRVGAFQDMLDDTLEIAWQRKSSN